MSKRQKRDDSILQNLLRSIVNEEWHDITKYLDEAKLSDRHNDHALHMICKSKTSPMQVVKDIYYAYPQAAMIKNHGQTPISIATNKNFEDAVEFLANACPESCVIDTGEDDEDDGYCTGPLKSILFSRIYNENTMIDSIINANPQAGFIQDEDGIKDCAFDYFFNNWNLRMRVVVRNLEICKDNIGMFIGYGDWKICDVYEKMCLFLKASSNYRKGKKLDHNLLLHYALSEKTVHASFCRLLIMMHPEQVLLRDNNGNLPIHIITSLKKECNTSDENTFECDDCWKNQSKLVYAQFGSGGIKYYCNECFECESKDDVTRYFHIKPVQKVYGMVKELVTIMPQMALIPDSQGNYPLHIAIHNQQSYDVIYSLYRAYPNTGKIRDLKTQLLPFMLAAVDNWDGNENYDQLTLTYLLLREDPLLVLWV